MRFSAGFSFTARHAEERNIPTDLTHKQVCSYTQPALYSETAALAANSNSLRTEPPNGPDRSYGHTRRKYHVGLTFHRTLMTFQKNCFPTHPQGGVLTDSFPSLLSSASRVFGKSFIVFIIFLTFVVQ